MSSIQGDMSFVIYSMIGTMLSGKDPLPGLSVAASIPSTKTSTYSEGVITRGQAPIFVPATYTVRNQIPVPVCPTEDASEALWNEYIENTTSTVKGEGPGEAQIILLGETHTEEWHRQWARALIMHYCSGRGAIVLIEGVKALKKVKRKFPIENVKCYGWDEEYWYYKAIKCVKSRVELMNIYQEDKPSVKWSVKDSEAWQELDRFSVECNKERDQSMIDTLKKVIPHLQPDQKVFVISGSNHLLRIMNRTEDFTGTQSTGSPIKIAMLIPKNLNSNSQFDETSYMKKLARHCRV